MWVRVVFSLVLVAVGIPREAVAQDSGCGTPKQQTGLSGTFSSMNYPNNYRDSARCTWIITVQPRWRIRIHFNSPFQFETHASCGYDYVRLSEEVTSTTPIGKYCNGPPTADVMSQDNDMVVVFKTDGSNIGKGFSLRWTAVEPELSGCGSRYKQSGTSGSISSMNFPNNYQNDADCSWIITVPAGMRVRLFFERKFEVEPSPLNNCNFDYVVVRQVDAAAVMGRSFGTFCGLSAPTNLLLSDDNDIAVGFKSDSTTTFAGFSIKWKAIYACGTPERLLNGAVALSDGDKVNSKATYSCDVGFKLVGKNRQCLTSGRWAGEPPKCQEILCPPPLVPSQGSVSLTNQRRVNSTATYTCDDGFQVRGGLARQCLISGRWSGETPSCQEIHCGTPGVPANGSMSLSDGDRMNSKATYNCDDDFLLHGDRVRECLHAWTWSGETPTCQEIRCSSPELVANGSVALADEDKIGSKATYMCDNGFKLIGTSERRCLLTGNWSGDMPICGEIRCGSPPLPVDGSVALSNEDKIGSKATYSCDGGFQLIGRPERQCLKTGNWSGDMPICEEIRCGSPPLPVDGSVALSNEDKIGSKATYSCDGGFQLIGRPERQCLRTGNWSGDMPICEEIRCGSPPLPVDGSVALSNEDKIGSKTTYSCDGGFQLIGRPERQCLRTGNWSGDMPICEEIRCGSPPLPVDGSVALSNEDKIGSKATYSCDGGFQLIGRPERQCLRTGNWSGDMPICEEIRCGSPPLPVDGSVALSNEDKIGSKATYSCDGGFQLIGRPERQCLRTGNWSGGTTVCEEIRCGSPPLPVNGSVSLSNEDKIGSRATYGCDDRFKLIGTSEHQCLLTGNWSGDMPVCEEIRCGALSLLVDGSVALSNEDKIGSRATYSCDGNFKMIGTSERQCQMTGNWSGDRPVCEGIRCGGPPLLVNGSVSLTNEDNIGSKATYSCNDGFKLIGHPERQCQYTGNWGGGTSTCEEIRCGFPSFPANGSVLLSDGDRMNSNATYICDDGFLLTGEGVRECHKTGNWSGDTPTCQEIHCGFPGTLVNGNVSLSDEDRVNSKATYTCDGGFLLTGEDVRECQNTGNWSGDPPICQLQEIRCGYPEAPGNGSVSLSDEDRINSTASYMCDDRFDLSGERVSKCLSTGNWSRQTPTCQEIRCGFPGTPGNGSVSLSDKDRVNSRVTYRCDDGFLLIGESVRECEKTGNWSGEVSTCQEIRCGSPGVPANCSLALSDGDRMNSRAVYTCDSGFKIIGHPERECLRAGNWSGDRPVCEELKEIRCGYPPLSVNGSVSLSNENKIGSKTTYSCDDGFKLIGTSERQCLLTGNWSGDLPVCEGIRCGDPPLLVDGSVSLTNEDNIGSKATYSCDDGFQLIGRPERQCLRTGNWSGGMTVCEVIRCGSPPLPVNGSVALSNEDKIGSKATYSCDGGFQVIGRPERQCLRTGSWSGGMTVCEVIRCGSPPLPVNGSVALSNEDKIGSRATYGCDGNFKLIGTSERQCQMTGNWSGDMTVCEVIRCGSPPLPVDGSVSLSNEDNIRSRATYSCNGNFKLIGTSERQCQMTGNWSGNMPVCEGIRCGDPPLLVNGNVALSNEDMIGSKSTYSCHDGFKLIGTAEHLCLRRGDWSGDSPNCQEIRCGPPDKLESGRILLSNEDRLNSKARYVCNDGLVLSGDSERRCGLMGSWSGRTPSCKEIRCGPLEQPAHGRVFLSDQDKWNSQATYACNDGNRMFGKAERLCLATWKWSGTAPSCQGTEDPRSGISLPPKQNAVPASWSNSPYMYAYRCIGIVFNIVFLILGVCGSIYGVYRIMRRRGVRKRSSFNFDNPTFSGAKEQETQIA